MSKMLNRLKKADSQRDTVRDIDADVIEEKIEAVKKKKRTSAPVSEADTIAPVAVERDLPFDEGVSNDELEALLQTKKKQKVFRSFPLVLAMSVSIALSVAVIGIVWSLKYVDRDVVVTGMVHVENGYDTVLSRVNDFYHSVRERLSVQGLPIKPRQKILSTFDADEDLSTLSGMQCTFNRVYRDTHNQYALRVDPLISNAQYTPYQLSYEIGNSIIHPFDTLSFDVKGGAGEFVAMELVVAFHSGLRIISAEPVPLTNEWVHHVIALDAVQGLQEVSFVSDVAFIVRPVDRKSEVAEVLFDTVIFQ